MSDDLRAEIYNNLDSKETEELLEIWQNGDITEWSEEVFAFVKAILLERLGHVPPQSIQTQVAQVLSNVDRYLEKDELDKALSECELAIQMSPDLAIAYNYRGEIYEEMGQLEKAITNYQTAIQLDPEFRVAWDNLLIAEKDFEEEFHESIAKRHLDQALEYAYSDEPEGALAECEAAKMSLPSISIAYNYLGLILQTLNQLEPAIDSYLHAIKLNPRFYAARENLADARVSWEEEQYRFFSSWRPSATEGTVLEFDGSQIPESDDPIPQWLYMDEKAFLLVGWAGHRTREGRSGYDPLEMDFEQAHMQGVIFGRLITRTFRTRNPIYLIIMACMGVLFSAYGAVPFMLGKEDGIFLGIISSPYLIVGIALLVNVYLSLRLEEPSESEGNGYTFF